MQVKKGFKYLAIVRKTAPVFLTMVFFLPVTFTCALFKIRQISIHKTIEAIIDNGVGEDQMILLKIPPDIKEDHSIFEQTEENEFRFNGKMYDVVKSENHLDSTWYWCIWDENETELEDNLKEVGNKALGSDSENKKIEELLSLFLNFLFLSHDQPEIAIQFEELRFFTGFRINNKLNPAATPPAPPPKY